MRSNNSTRGDKDEQSEDMPMDCDSNPRSELGASINNSVRGDKDEQSIHCTSEYFITSSLKYFINNAHIPNLKTFNSHFT